MTNRERVLAALANASVALDDDELALRTGVQPRQTINQICTRLAAEGAIIRSVGPAGKLVNTLPSQPLGVDAPSQPPVAASAGSSHEQHAAEAVMREALGQRLDLDLAPRRLEHASGARVEVDCADERLTVLAELWAHQGTAKVAQKYKLVNDAVKLHWIAQSLSTSPKLILCVSDEAAIRHLRGRSWQGQAIASLGVELVVVELPSDTVASITEAQKRQFR